MWLKAKARASVSVTLALALVAGCASVGRPPGGPVDTDPPVIVSASIDTNATGVTAKEFELRFNEVISERPAVSGGPGSPVTLEAIVLLSPRTGGVKVDWSRQAITVEPRGGFKPNTTYRITLLPGLSDIRGNVSRTARSWVFSTGSQILPFGILGRVFDWQAGVIAPGAVVEAVANAGTADSAVYVAAADSLGQFELGPLGAGRYLVRTYIDNDRNRERGVLEKWDTVTVTVTDHRPSIELLAAQRDSAPVGIQRAQALDSVWVRIELDKPYNPRVQLVPSMLAIVRSDSSVIQVEGLMTEERALVLRQRADTGAQPATNPPPATVGPPSTRPPVAQPSLPRPQNVMYARVNPLTPLRTGERYTITVRALPNLQGRSGSSPAVFDGPAAPARPPG